MIHVMLPVQYLRKAGAHRIEPQKRLMLAVLQTVIDDYQGSKNRRAAGAPGPRDRKAFEQVSAALAAAQIELAAAEERWLELEILRETIVAG